MTRPLKKKARGRPKKVIDWRMVERLCRIQCTQEEIASVTGLSVDTLDRACQRERGMNFAEYFRQKGDFGRKSLRRKQWDLALKGDRTMLVWLGKQYLNQKESPLIESNNTTHNNTLHVDAGDDNHSTTELIGMLLEREPMRVLNASQSDDIDDICGKQEVK